MDHRTRALLRECAMRIIAAEWSSEEPVMTEDQACNHAEKLVQVMKIRGWLEWEET